MDETWIINGSTPDAVMTWLGDIAALARRKQREESNRPQTPVLHAGEIDPHKLPLPVRSRAARCGGIYAQRPAAGRPFGKLHLLVLVEEVGERAMRVEIAATPGFALRSDEVRGSFQQTFPRATRGAAGRRTGLLLRINQESASDHTGAPVLSCNVWLEEQLAHVTDRAERRKLFRPWLDRYRALRGLDPADPSRSFRAAVAGCEERLSKRGIRVRSTHENVAQPKHRTAAKPNRQQDRERSRHSDERSFATEQGTLNPKPVREGMRRPKPHSDLEYEW